MRAVFIVNSHPKQSIQIMFIISELDSLLDITTSHDSIETKGWARQSSEYFQYHQYGLIL